MRSFLLVAWPGAGSKSAFWVERFGPDRIRICEEPGTGTFVNKVEVFYEVDAENLEDAKIKFDLGAMRFGYINKGKSVYCQGLTAGDRSAIDRATRRILAQLSDEAVEFLVTVSGCVPSANIKQLRQQLQLLLIGQH